MPGSAHTNPVSFVHHEFDPLVDIPRDVGELIDALAALDQLTDVELHTRALILAHSAPAVLLVAALEALPDRHGRPLPGGVCAVGHPTRQE